MLRKLNINTTISTVKKLYLGSKLNPLPPTPDVPEFVIYTTSGKPLKTKSEKFIKLKKAA